MCRKTQDWISRNEGNNECELTEKELIKSLSDKYGRFIDKGEFFVSESNKTDIQVETNVPKAKRRYVF